MERSVKGCGWRAAGARRNFTPAARCNGLARSDAENPAHTDAPFSAAEEVNGVADPT
jgi:hypothetical protein